MMVQPAAALNLKGSGVSWRLEKHIAGRRDMTRKGRALGAAFFVGARGQLIVGTART